MDSSKGLIFHGPIESELNHFIHGPKIITPNQCAFDSDQKLDIKAETTKQELIQVE